MARHFHTAQPPRRIRREIASKILVIGCHPRASASLNPLHQPSPRSPTAALHPPGQSANPQCPPLPYGAAAPPHPPRDRLKNSGCRLPPSSVRQPESPSPAQPPKPNRRSTSSRPIREPAMPATSIRRSRPTASAARSPRKFWLSSHAPRASAGLNPLHQPSQKPNRRSTSRPAPPSWSIRKPAMVRRGQPSGASPLDLVPRLAPLPTLSPAYPSLQPSTLETLRSSAPENTGSPTEHSPPTAATRPVAEPPSGRPPE